MKLPHLFRPDLIALSVLLTSVAALTAFSFIDILCTAAGQRRRLWLAAGAAASGFSLWSMHFLVVQAFLPREAVSYSIPLVVASLCGAIFTSLTALVCVVRRTQTPLAATVTSLLMSTGLWIMHLTGTAAISAPRAVHLHPFFILLAALVTFLFCGASLQTVAHSQSPAGAGPVWRVSSACVTSLGLAALLSVCVITVPLPTQFALLLQPWMQNTSSLSVVGVAGVTGLIAAAAFLSTSMERYLSRQSRIRMAMIAQLQESNTLREAIVDSALFAIISTDLNGMIRSVNRAAIQMLGYSAQEMIGNMSLLHLHDPAEVEEQAIRLSVQLRRGIPADVEAITTLTGDQRLDEREWTYMRRDGQAVPVRLSISPLQFAGSANDELSSQQGFLIIAQDISAQKSAEQTMRRMALYDPLTGLPNRTLLEEQIIRSLALAGRHRLQVSLAVIDLDRFKQINDSLGRLVGDEVLLLLSRRLTETVRTSDMVVRLGSDEFVILMPGIEHPRQSLDVMQRVLQALSEPICLEGQEFYVTPSIGISAFPNDGHDLNTLLRKADRAMYKAKSRGRNSVAIFSSEFESEASSLLAMDSALRRAIKRNEFFLVYQPIFHIPTGEISGLEALIRWQQPDGSVLSPAGFIPLAEETGLIFKIGEWVLRTACARVGMFSRAARKPLRMAVNISPYQFRDPQLLQCIQETLATTGIEPSQLELEITEGVLLDDSSEAEETIRQLRTLGIQIAMDDFGTGYSSLGYLKRFPIDRLKIDRSFVTGMESTRNDLTLTEAVIKMGHSLNAQVTAEGVESAQQWQYLCEQGCDDAQGFHLARPMRAEQLLEFLLSRAEEQVSARLAAHRPAVSFDVN
ncbi:EAL domain-containing protein [Silvibacterium sp.]|uniref:EAL domain-containing protein n=1 Tax=Silvibacterium sp. TaxID=1964179 RepID=UPI0039E29FE8